MKNYHNCMNNCHNGMRNCNKLINISMSIWIQKQKLKIYL